MTSPAAFLSEQAAHFAALDPLLPEPVLPVGGEPIGSLDAGRRPLLGILRQEHHPPGVLSSLWSARASQYLHPLVADGADLEPLLRRWRELLDDRRDTGVDSACVVTWPSRDTTATGVLLRHGFVPLTVLAVRHGAPAPTTEPASTTESAPEPTVRAATTADLPTLEELSLVELAYAADVGAAVVRPDAAELKADSLRMWLDAGWPVALAELDGEAIGMAQYRWARLDAEARPKLVPEGVWGYVSCLSVRPQARGRGVGRALMRAAHARMGQAGVAGSYLYYNPANPRSSVFWPRQGYRPLWTVWEIRPASALR